MMPYLSLLLIPLNKTSEVMLLHGCTQPALCIVFGAWPSSSPSVYEVTYDIFVQRATASPLTLLVQHHSELLVIRDFELYCFADIYMHLFFFSPNNLGIFIWAWVPCTRGRNLLLFFILY